MFISSISCERLQCVAVIQCEPSQLYLQYLIFNWQAPNVGLMISGLQGRLISYELNLFTFPWGTLYEEYPCLLVCKVEMKKLNLVSTLTCESYHNMAIWKKSTLHMEGLILLLNQCHWRLVMEGVTTSLYSSYNPLLEVIAPFWWVLLFWWQISFGLLECSSDICVQDLLSSWSLKEKNYLLW